MTADHGRLVVRSFDFPIAGPGRAGRRDRKASSFSVHASVPPILDCVVAAVSQSASDFGPSLAHIFYHAFNHQALLGGNGLSIQRRLQVLVESFPALLGRSKVHVLGDANPIVGTLFTD